MTSSCLSFDKSRRLLNAGDYKAVFDKAEFKVSRQRFLCLARKNNQTYPRLGLIIAKKNVRLAVQRNLLKRIIRESFRLHQGELGNLDIIILARNTAGEMDKPYIHDEVSKIWQRLIKKKQTG